ncbi:hypothetical protein TNCV_4780761 [Trichonephila clavipes]|nr:hypothetical protein TNCV_4780761 [Trichonephila clavipes]
MKRELAFVELWKLGLIERSVVLGSLTPGIVPERFRIKYHLSCSPLEIESTASSKMRVYLIESRLTEVKGSKTSFQERE